VVKHRGRRTDRAHVIESIARSYKLRPDSLDKLDKLIMVRLEDSEICDNASAPFYPLCSHTLHQIRGLGKVNHIVVFGVMVNLEVV